MALTPSPTAPANRPERDGAGVPEGIARLLHLLRWIVGYGKTLAGTLHQCAAADFHDFAAMRYRRSDFNEILARIKRGLMIAAALEAKLLRRAATGRDVVPVSVRYPSPGRKPADTTRKRTTVRYTNIVDMPPDPLPTAEEIAAELRRRPIGAVLADLCRDLGIRPGDLTREQWNELEHAIIAYGGDVCVLFFREAKIRLQAIIDADLRSEEPAPVDSGSACNKAARPTGPPEQAMAA